MRVMWLTGLILPKIEGKSQRKSIGSGGWVLSMLEELERNKEIEAIDIVSVYSGKKTISVQDNKIRYTVLPGSNAIFKYDRNLHKYIQQEIDYFKPDVIDVHGIELYLVKSLLDINTEIPIIATLQGLTSEIYKYYYAGISIWELIKNRTIRDNIFLHGVIERKLYYKNRGKNEKQVLKQLKFVIGRTQWDKAVSISHNPKLKYFKCNRNLRYPFYNNIWDIKKSEKFRLFMTQAHYPIKGLHILLEALKYLKSKYPLIKLYIGGKNMISRTTVFEKLSFSGYQKYIKKLIFRYKLEKHVVFTGFLSASQVVDQLMKAHVFVLPSVIENSPNALAEAQILGVPSVASFVGGVEDYVENNKTGLLYNCYEPLILANKIEQIFKNNSLALRLSKNSIHAANNRHDRKENLKALMKAYSEIIDKNGI